MRAGGLLLLAALALTGCLVDTSVVNLEKDGRGTYVQTITVDMPQVEAHVAQLKARARDRGQTPDDDGASPLDAIDATKREAMLRQQKGVRVVRASRADDPSKKTRTYRLEVAFDSLEQMFRSGVVEHASVKLERLQDGKAWKLTVRRVFDSSDSEPLTGEAAEKLRRMRTALLKRYEPLWRDLVITTRLELPTKIVATNGSTAHAEAGNLVTWSIPFADLADPTKLVQHVTFEHADDLKLRPFTLSAADIANSVARAERAAAKAARKAKKKKRAAQGGN